MSFSLTEHRYQIKVNFLLCHKVYFSDDSSVIPSQISQTLAKIHLATLINTDLLAALINPLKSTGTREEVFRFSHLISPLYHIFQVVVFI